MRPALDSLASPGDDTAAPSPGARASKTQRKKDSHALQELGEALVALSDAQLGAMSLDESLLEAIRLYKQTRTHEGLRRQMQYIGKLMRRADAEPLREAVAQALLGSARDSLVLHQAEAWRAELLASDEGLTRWSGLHPQSDLQQLRSLVRAARKDVSAAPEQRSGRSFRELFRFIRQHLGAAAGETADDTTDE